MDSDIHSTVDSDTSDVQHLDLTTTESHRPSKERTVNVFLLVACVIFGAASFLFGFDDKIISPVAALHPFVSRPLRGVKPPNPTNSGIYSSG